ncbi:MAG: flagellar biosynthetic protein FliR [Rhodospirillaceae bacterium]|nr:flagellar biosynthetic protein FliR [Rhodospirillaceae bacterium]
MLEQLINLNLFAFLLIFSRIGSAFMLLPGIGQQFVSPNIRLTFALLVSFVMTPVLMNTLPAMPPTVAETSLILVGEVLIGIFLGLIPRIVMAALQTAGTVLSLVSSMANMFVLDPISEQQSSLLSTFLGIMGIVLVFVSDTHHLMIAAITESYTIFIPGGPLAVGDMADVLARKTADSFRIGVQLSSPLILTGLAYYVGLGIMGRLMPQLPVFFFGLPAQITTQITVIAIALPGMMLVFMTYLENNLINLAIP